MERSRSPYIRVYLVLEVILFIAIKIAEFTLPLQPTKVIKYSAIVVNTIMAVHLYRRYGKTAPDRWDHLIFLALMVNCVADIFLTLTGGERMFVPGFAAFCTIEAIYAVYLRPNRVNLAIRAALLVIFLLVARQLGLLTLPNALGVLNLTLLFMNVVSAWMARKRERSLPSLLFAVGLTSFLAGDISVALEIFSAEGTLFHTVVTLAVWVFYIPAQVLIVLTYYGRIRLPESVRPARA